MKYFFTLLTTCILTISASSQITFDKGYYKNNAGEKQEVLIKNVGWKNNPSEITFKTSEAAVAQTLQLKDVSEFGIDNETIYLRAQVPIDKSNHNLKDLSNHGRFEYEEEQVFLKMLVDGKADLLHYKNGSNEQFFFRNDNSKIEALVYKRYVPEFSVRISENNQYQQDLFNTLQCEQLDQNDFTGTDYKKKDLVKFFTRYNNCQNTEFKNFSDQSKRDAFNLSIRPGINFSSLNMKTYVVQRSIDFEEKITFRLGLEGEYILPFLRNKWALIAEPTYQYFQSEAVFPEGRFGDAIVEVNYQSLEIPFGVRHYFFLNESNRIFLNLTYTVDLVMGDSSFDFQTAAIDSYDQTDIDTNTGTNFSLGGGFSHKRYSVEARYHLDRSLTGKKMSLGTEYSTFSFIFGYNFL
ncbi:hypothetical protein [Salinimicrobium sp. GXAS 041]|uniref:hypothetical protein n=1 Tax=Salinimicrobium sp. GXAS 041 TaxID=3400806 RepID=UPI003C77FF5F